MADSTQAFTTTNKIISVSRLTVHIFNWTVRYSYIVLNRSCINEDWLMNRIIKADVVKFICLITRIFHAETKLNLNCEMHEHLQTWVIF